MIIRHNGKRAIQVQADVETGMQVEKVRSILEEKFRILTFRRLFFGVEWGILRTK